MSELTFEVEVELPEVDVSVEEPVVAAVLVAGPPGPPGPGATVGFSHNQVSASSNWIVSHTLGRYPLSSEVTVSGEVVHADIEYPDVFTAVVTFANPQAGTLRLT